MTPETRKNCPNMIESLFLDDRTHELQKKVNDKLVEVGKEYAEE